MATAFVIHGRLLIDGHTGWKSWGFGVQFSAHTWRLFNNQKSWTLSVRFLPFNLGVSWNLPEEMVKEWYGREV